MRPVCNVIVSVNVIIAVVSPHTEVTPFRRVSLVSWCIGFKMPTTKELTKIQPHEADPTPAANGFEYFYRNEIKSLMNLTILRLKQERDQVTNESYYSATKMLFCILLIFLTSAI